MLEVPRYIEALASEGKQLADAALAAGTDAPVPTCPDWTVADLLLHTAGVHRWAREIVALGLAEPGADGHYFQDGPRDRRAVDDYVAAHAALCAALAEAPAQLECFSFLAAPSPLVFWARRQCHETAIHRADADAAAGIATRYDPELAADGIDELLTAFVPRPRSRLRSERPWSIGVRATDAGAAWTVHVSEDPPHAERARTDATVVVEGDASDLYRFLWNRRDAVGLTISGDDSRLDEWRDLVTVRWS